MKTLKSTMSFCLKFSIILLITTGFTPTPTTVNASFFQWGCSSIAAAAASNPCSEEFERTMEPNMARSSGLDEYWDGHKFTYCCAVTQLRYCILDKIGATCGDKAENTANDLVDKIVSAVKLIDGNQPCDGNEWYFRKESPLCWDFCGPLTGITIVTIMLITICCCCCIRCCGKKRTISKV